MGLGAHFNPVIQSSFSRVSVEFHLWVLAVISTPEMSDNGLDRKKN